MVQECGSKNRRQLLIICRDCLIHRVPNSPFMWWGGGEWWWWWGCLVSCKNTPALLPPCKPQPINASLTPRRLRDAPPPRSPSPLNAAAPFAPHAISPNALMRCCHNTGGALSQHALQVDPLPLADLITAAGPAGQLGSPLQRSR